ncbi:hypothetical protein [Bacillus sp. NSP9.1]|uniref:hypothetical protein n=1 Tax=Bacillus sp. NSP9.1 TaxID=1071078 RepID=UPI00047A8EF5|nr:hypothetical protein [Bacillus sp. NSP9.1]QHZ45925.1 hypothetical protein M654_006165 [Bacillus sp. NSP9.1]
MDIEEAAEHLAKCLKSCPEEMKLGCHALGKAAVKQLNRSDLVTVGRNLSEKLVMPERFNKVLFM